MRKILLFLSFTLLSVLVRAQEFKKIKDHRRDSLKKINNRRTLLDFLYCGTSEGSPYIGLTNSFEMLSYYIGGEFKLYDSHYIGLNSGSIYTNFRTTVFTQNPQTNFNSISIGGHFMFVGLEGVVYFKRNESIFYFTPKLGYDNGGWSVFYGYALPLSKTEYHRQYSHNISLKYHLYLNAFKYHKSRKKSWGY